jgi:hypothetical protein
MIPSPICFRFDAQDDRRAFSRARAKTGNRIAARIAIIAMTTSNSIKVNPRLDKRGVTAPVFGVVFNIISPEAHY